MQSSANPHRAAIIDALFGQICRATPLGARELAMLLTATERAEMALFCYSRSHLREQGRSIAAACVPGSLVKVGGAAGQALAAQADVGENPPGTIARPGKRAVSLAGR